MCWQTKARLGIEDEANTTITGNGLCACSCMLRRRLRLCRRGGNGRSSVTDPSTMSDWQAVVGSDTSNIGRIWTDKTVSADETITVSSGQQIERGNSAFITALSALSSTSNVLPPPPRRSISCWCWMLRARWTTPWVIVTERNASTH